MIKTNLFFVNSYSIPSYSSMSNLFFFRNIYNLISAKIPYLPDQFRIMTTLFRTLRNLSVKNPELPQTKKGQDEEFILEKEQEMLNSIDSRNTVSLVLPRFVLFCSLGQ